MKTIIVTSGEPAGIGPDIALALAHTGFDAAVIVAGDIHPLRRRAAQLGVAVSLYEAGDGAPRRHAGDGHLAVRHVALKAPVADGRLEPRNSDYVLELIDGAVDGLLAGRFSALVTGPVSKAAVIRAGGDFSGHTEYLAARAGAHGVMLLETGRLRVALATTHLPLSAVAGALTRERIETTLSVVHADLQKRFRIASPRIAVCGLNPHAGEQGCLGREEETVIAPAIERMKNAGMHLRGPLPADTAFTPESLRDCDVVVAMYHDQGLPVVKHAGFGAAVNITLGLPFVRTSVDHGTALELAGSGRASPSSLVAAVRRAVQLCDD